MAPIVFGSGHRQMVFETGSSLSGSGRADWEEQYMGRAGPSKTAVTVGFLAASAGRARWQLPSSAASATLSLQHCMLHKPIFSFDFFCQQHSFDPSSSRPRLLPLALMLIELSSLQLLH
jgi:hypothetical protein